jgi:AcrR family transcriptional regulator
MVRPSTNTDLLLLSAGRELFPKLGCKGLSARKLADHAGVNLGMFHYHFRSKDNFIRLLLQQFYEEMFAELTLKTANDDAAINNLRAALMVIALFARSNHQLLLRVVADAMDGEMFAMRFLRDNVPRHLEVLSKLITHAQREGHIANVPLLQALMFITGAVLLPVLAGSFIAAQGNMLQSKLSTALNETVLTDSAIAERIHFALRGIAKEEN